VLFQLGGIQSKNALPGDPTLSPLDNPYDEAAYDRLCCEFGIAPSSDFRFKRGVNHSLGAIYLYMYDIDATSKAEWAHFPEYHVFEDKHISYTMPDARADRQYDWFAPKTSPGLTQAGLSRINPAIEAFVYCVLGAQVNVRSSILGEGVLGVDGRRDKTA